ncbi:SDR family NAD(P)-dependent oxidoreductase [Parasphingorhabdus halotolerans]|uniref:SDR family oxidoreductase n=1 Tax=Parasphingorhabdus halotolerans TaxID=2725558 RepID=A0A6H2DHJ4_9SPHN|nr:SDR family NAD(P)-dependent oxidoreductase [Parasphingorhabdus halotolerans]QJB68139.1 SDR family oxidoreductase [Parasphingorhabdus halotolerans]
MQLEGKTAAITGGTAGIGRGIAEAYLAEGANVAIMARNPDNGAKITEEMNTRHGNGRAIFVAGDVMDQNSVEGFIDATVAQFGTIDILVNNAGGASDLAPLVDLTDKAFDETMKWNIYSTFWATRRALKTMIAQKSGRVINISSTEGKMGKPTFAPYTVAKHGIIGMTKSVAQEVGTMGITVNAICPGLVITDIIKNGGPATASGLGMTFDEMITMFSQESALKRPNTVEEIAAMALLLASDAGSGITGTALSVDGGTAQY